MRFFFVHGWGFDTTLWDRLAPLLPEWPSDRLDRGYFGQFQEPSPTTPFVAVAHSFGAMLMLRGMPAECRGLIAINGFERFSATPNRAGVAPRVLDRMIARFDEDAPAVLAEFRRRCGWMAPFQNIERERLRQDLRTLRDGDYREQAARFARPILSVQGGADPILPTGLRESAFASASVVNYATSPGGGHLLPVTDPDFCANQIRVFASRCQ